MSLASQRGGLFPVGEETIKGEKPRRKETYFDQVFFFFFCSYGPALKREITEQEEKKKKNSLKLPKR